jgi:hypothetical protein
MNIIGMSIRSAYVSGLISLQRSMSGP